MKSLYIIRFVVSDNQTFYPTFNFIGPLGQAVKTPPFHGGNTGSSPVGVILLQAGLAQLVEQLTCNQ